MTQAIEIKNLHFKYERNTILKDVDLQLDEKGFYVFLGPNGGGKTTLIKLIMGLLVPKKGSVKVYGKSPKEQASRFGYIPQSLQFDPIFPLSVFEFVQQGLLSSLPWHGRWPKSTFEKTTAILEKFELESIAKNAIGEISGGQLQRAIIARALVKDPEFLVLDEPLSGLDHKSAKNIISLIEEMRGKKTIILITHVITHLLNKADKVFLIEKGVSPLQDEALCKHIKLGLFHSEDEGCNHE